MIDLWRFDTLYMSRGDNVTWNIDSKIAKIPDRLGPKNKQIRFAKRPKSRNGRVVLKFGTPERLKWGPRNVFQSVDAIIIYASYCKLENI